MGKNTVMTPEICKQTEELRQGGCSYAFIANKLGVTEGSISHYCLKEGIESPNTKSKVLPQTAPGPMELKRGNHVVRHFTLDEDRRIHEMASLGMTVAAIAKALDRRWNSTHGRMMTLARQQERAEAPMLERAKPQQLAAPQSR